MSERHPAPTHGKATPTNSLEEILCKDPDALTAEEVTVLKREMLARMTELIAAQRTGKVTPTHAELPPQLREEVEWIMPLGAGGYAFQLNGVYYHGKCRAPRHVYNQLMRIYQENAQIESERLQNRGIIGAGVERDTSFGHRIPEATRVA